MVGWMVLHVLRPTMSHSKAEPANALDMSDVVCGVHKGCALPGRDLVAGVEFLHLMR